MSRAGIKNIITADVKQSIMSVYHELGSAEGLLKWAQKNQTEYYRMLVAIMPREQKVEFVNPLMSVTASDLARLVESISRSRGITVPSSVNRIIEQEVRALPPVSEAKTVS